MTYSKLDWGHFSYASANFFAIFLMKYKTLMIHRLLIVYTYRCKDGIKITIN